jgi:preprotein translocase subunit Sec61beta
MADNRIQMPSSQGGLVNYYDDYKSRFQLRPEHVVILVIVVIAIELLLHWKGSLFFGL